jgi:hypothetical protein
MSQQLAAQFESKLLFWSLAEGIQYLFTEPIAAFFGGKS